MRFFRNSFIVYLMLFSLVTSFFAREGIAITINQEEELSKDVLAVVSRQFEIITDPLVAGYVRRVGDRILSGLPSQLFTYHFYVLKSDVYNAFATPAGHIFINSGLIEAMDDEEELAGILAHEIAHVVCRHISQKIERSKKINLATLAGIAAGVFLGSGGNTTAANAVTMGTLASGQSIALAYSREDETQADQLALDYLEKAGYSPKGLFTTLKKIRSKEWLGEAQFPTYLRTHPASEQRMVFIGAWIEAKPELPPPKDPYEFQRARARLVGMYGEESTALSAFESAVKDDPGNPLAQYGYGLILTRMGNRKDAVSHFQAALEKKPFDPYMLRDLGVSYFSDGQYAAALGVLESVADLLPSDPEGLFYLARTQMEMGQYMDAAAAFELLLDKFPDYNEANYYLGETCSRLQRYGDAHYYLGRYYKNRDQLKNSMFHLMKAADTMDNPDKKIEIEEMLKEIQKRVRDDAQNPMKQQRK